MGALYYVLITVITLTVSIYATGNYIGTKQLESLDNYQGIKNLWEADSQAELAALKNKRFYNEGLNKILNGSEELLLQDVSYMTQDNYKKFIDNNVKSDYKGYGSNSDRDWDGIGTYAGGQKGIDLNIDMTTKRLSLDSETNVLNSYSNNVYELPINSNIKYLSDDSSQLFASLQLRWGDWYNGWKPDYQWDIQVTLYRFDVNQNFSEAFDRKKMFETFGKEERTLWEIMAKKILRVSESSNSASMTNEANPLNPQAPYFHKAVTLKDIVGWDVDLNPKKYVYYLVIESMSSNPIPVLVEAYNSTGQAVGFVGDYKTTYDSTGLGLGNNRKRIQLFQTLKSQRMKYFSKSVYTEQDLSKEVVEEKTP